MDPIFNRGNWHQNHMQAHDDSLNALPSEFGQSKLVGLRIGQDLRDTDLDDPRKKTWWEFQNHREHYIANGTISPFLPDLLTQFPFW
jgi:hypothetical protein